MRCVYRPELARHGDRDHAGAAIFPEGPQSSAAVSRRDHPGRAEARPSRICGHAHHAGFSLVEMLVVLGVITLLISLLMPTLTTVRMRAEQVKCQANLRTIGQAAMLHMNDHLGRLPVAGWHWTLKGGVANAAGLEDAGARLFVYYDEGGEERPAPITAALAVSLGIKVPLDSRENLEAALAGDGIRRYFLCPSDLSPGAGLSQKGEGWTAPMETSSYVFNEAILGQREAADWRTQPPPLGKITRIKRPGVVMLAMDGRPRNQTNDPWLVTFDHGPEWSLYDFQQATELPNVGYGKETFDYTRHRYRANVLFADFHVDSIPMTEAGLKSVGVSMGVYQ
ncbi:MAG: competence type IV pilus major pilin ComGC [Tepidisphaerales bacterium]